MDGSKHAAPWLREAVKTYASCIGQSSKKLFFAIAALKNKVVLIADNTNALSAISTTYQIMLLWDWHGPAIMVSKEV